MSTKHLLIKGTVQGVFYRASAKKEADKLKLSGWIKNTREGDVEAVVSGYDNDVEKFISWCNIGPEKAEVSEVIVTDMPDTSFGEFEVIRGR